MSCHRRMVAVRKAVRPVVGIRRLDLLVAVGLAELLAELAESPLLVAAWCGSRRLVWSNGAGRRGLLRGRQRRELGLLLGVEGRWRRGFLAARIGRESLETSEFFLRAAVCFDQEIQHPLT